MRKAAFIFVTLGLAACIACASCGHNGIREAAGIPDPPFQGDVPEDAYVYTGEPGVYGGRLVLGSPDEIKTLNVALAPDTATADVLWLNVARCPVDYNNEKEAFDPGLCTSWDTSPDATEWTFHLRRGVRWSDGEPFNADDVIFTYDVTVDEKAQAVSREIFIEGTDVQGNPVFPSVQKIDDYTVRFKLNHPNFTFLDQIYNLWLIPRHKWEGAWRSGNFQDTLKLTDDPNNVVSLGPFRIKEYVSGQRILLERNPYFWKVDSRGQRLPYLDRIVIVITKDFNTVQAQFEAGEIDVMPRVRPQDHAGVKRLESASIRVEEVGISYDPWLLAFNQNPGRNPKSGEPYVEPWKLELFRNQKFRQAVSYAIDREGIANTVFSARAVPIYSCVSPGDHFWYSDDVMKYPYEPERARRMLAEIGLKDTNGDGFLEDAQGHTLEFTINTNSSNSQRVDTAVFVARNLRDIGIKANPSPISFQVLVDMTAKRFNFDAVVLGWQINPPPGLTGSKNILLSVGQSHVCYPTQKTPSTPWEARIDELAHKIESTSELAERKTLYAEIQRIWSEQLPEINLVAAREAIAYRNKFGNLHPTALPPRVTWNSEEIYIKQ